MKPKKPCSVKDCAELRVGAQPWCNRHYRRMLHYGHLGLRQAPHGSGCLDCNGYIKVKVNGKHTYEHRVVMERKLGKPIPKGYLVHHKDENRSNNHPNNLMLMTHRQHEFLHQKLRHKI